MNRELVLDAGACEEVSGERGRELLIRPPEVSLFHQVIAYLRAKPGPVAVGLSKISREGAATAALALRWGSYLEALYDKQTPIWTRVKSFGTGRITDGEMARINIEASAALAEWIDIYRVEPSGGLYADLVEKAIAYLPMPQRAARREIGIFSDLAVPEFAAHVVAAAGSERRERVRDEAERRPSRMLANALLNVAWRNAPIESIHIGEGKAPPIAQGRISKAEERALMRFTSDRMAAGMWACMALCAEQSPRSWPEKILPYGGAARMLITPVGWTLTETSREVRLPL